MSEVGLMRAPEELPARQDASAPVPVAGVDVVTLGRLLAKSGYFKDARDEAQAVVRILYGQELGIGPVTAMMSIHIIEGKPCPSANLLASVIKRSRRYDYRIIERTDKRCELAFMERNGAGWAEAGRVAWTVEDAQRAELTKKDNWRKYPRAMLFGRAMSEGARVYCPELFGGAPVYTPEELGAEIDPQSGDPIALPAPAPVQDLAYWRRRTMALYAELGGEPSNKDACRADLATILGIEPASRTTLTLEQWRQCAEHMERQLREPDAVETEEDPFADRAAAAVAGAETGMGFAQASGL